MSEVWLVDDDTSILNQLEKILLENRYKVRAFNRPEEIIGELRLKQPSVIIIDIFFSNSSLTGEDIINEVIEFYPNTQTIIMSGETDVRKMLNCLNLGALDFLEKPVSLPRLLTSVKNAGTIYNTKHSNTQQFNILGTSKAIKDTLNKIKKLSKLNESVLIVGESGTGKEMAARNLHLYSKRFSQPLSIVNCTALNSNLIESELFGHKKGSFTGATDNKIGYFEKANGSSLFIDEIGDFPLELQVKLLRVLQEKKITPVGGNNEIDIDTRMIFATHQNLEKLVEENKFREDFYFRLSTFTVTMPPLRDRIEDIEILANTFLEKFLSENSLEFKTFCDSAIDKLKSYQYPGNIRELIQIVKNSAYFSEGQIITPEDITFLRINRDNNIWDITKDMSLAEGKKYFEKEFISRRLRKLLNNVEDTADSLGLIKNNLYRKLNTYDIEK